MESRLLVAARKPEHGLNETGQHQIGMFGQTGPDLLAKESILIVVPNSARLEMRPIGTADRFGKATGLGRGEGSINQHCLKPLPHDRLGIGHDARNQLGAGRDIVD